MGLSMSSSEAFRRQIVDGLREAIESRGKTVAGVEKELGRGRGYLGDALRGEKRLSLEILLEVLEHLGVAPVAFFSRMKDGDPSWRESGDVAEPRQESVALERLARLGGEAGDPLLRELAALLVRLVQRLEAAGVLEPGALEQGGKKERS